MPRYARPQPPLPDAVEDTIEAFGNRARLAMLGHLAQHDGCTRGDLAAALGIDPKTLQRHLGHLEDLGIVTADYPRDDRHGRRVRWRLDRDRAAELHAALGAHLGL